MLYSDETFGKHTVSNNLEEVGQCIYETLGLEQANFQGEY